ncbi:MAG: AmmeMemoRadiSam system protein B, partial [Candidatus Brocadiales bacterium]|nr:AmmeMemoRadiSam system protein B [Candidatus Brocadiales bacterium]
MIRQPVVAGTFYPSDAEALRAQIEGFVDKGCKKEKVLGIVAPHAGYMYSGKVAGTVFSHSIIPESSLILAPNHSRYGPPFSIWPDGSWRTPLGDVAIDVELVQELLSECDLLEKDKNAHKAEHSAEVMVPFLQYFNPKIKLAVIVIASGNLDELKTVGNNIASVLKRVKQDTLVIASSDMTHYESQQSANKKDKIAINEILALNEDELYKKVILEMNISMCGIFPAISMLVCSKERGAKTGK